MSDVERLFRHLVTSLLESDPAQLRRPIAVGELMARVLPYRTVRRALGVDSSEDYELLVLRLAGGEGGFAIVEPEPVQVRFAEEAVSVNPNLAVLQDFRDAQLRVDEDALAWVLAGHSREEMYAPPSPAAVDPETRAADRAAAEPLPVPPVVPPIPVPPAAAAPTAPAHPPAPEAPRAAPPVFERVPPRAPPPTSHAPPPLPPPPALPSGRPVGGAAPAGAPAPALQARRCSHCGGRLPIGRQVNFCPHCGHSQEAAACPYCEGAVEYGWQHCITCGGELRWE
jgi:hypothetical protein